MGEDWQVVLVAVADTQLVMDSHLLLWEDMAEQGREWMTEQGRD